MIEPADLKFENDWNDLVEISLRNLHVEPCIAVNLFIVFSRFEYAMKRAGFCQQVGRRDRSYVAPDWVALANDIGGTLSNMIDNENLARAISTLINSPPKIEKIDNNNIKFMYRPLRGKNEGQKALDAVKRVRNNLFHGGKYDAEPLNGRDLELIQASLTVLTACLRACPKIDEKFRGAPAD